MNRLVKLLTLQGRNADLLRSFVSLALIAMLAQLMAVLTWDIVALRRKSAPVPVQPVARVVAQPARSQGPDPALLNLFGQAARPDALPPAGQIQPGAENIPTTTLGLILKGVVGLKPKKLSFALISEKGRTEEEGVYGIGDIVAGGAELREIHREHVVLFRAGKLEILQLEEDVVRTTAPAAGGGESAAVKSGRSGPGIASRGDGVHWQINQAYLNERMADLPTLAKEIGLDVYKENDMQKGYRLISSRGSKLLEDLGLKPGDVLLEVNGIKLVDAHRGLLAYQKLREAAEVNMSVERNGVTKNMIYSIDKN